LNIFTSAKAEYALTPWQKKQAALLYHFSSLNYLKRLHHMVSLLVEGQVDSVLHTASAQHRDDFLVSDKWGIRNTSKNWANNAWPALKDLQNSLATDISMRAQGRYSFTAVNDRLTALAEYSLDWMTPGEEGTFKEALVAISSYDSPLFDIMSEPYNRMNDFTFAEFYKRYQEICDEIPVFRVRPDVSANTGDPTPMTGVYIALGNPHANLQFCWNSAGGMKLRNANVLSSVGLSALQNVGREELWLNDEKMFAFANAPVYADKFRSWIYVDDEPLPAAAAGAVSMHAFEQRPCKWAIVEVVPGEMEKLDRPKTPTNRQETTSERIPGGETCRNAGFYFAPSKQSSRRFFHVGERMPDLESTFGSTIWQRDLNQHPDA
jgi:hypothetical protein